MLNHYWKKAILRRSNRGYNDVFRTSLNVTSSKLKNFNDGFQNTIFESEQFSKTVLTSATSLKIGILRCCLFQQRLRMHTFKDVAEVSTIFESCSLSKTMFWDPSL